MRFCQNSEDRCPIAKLKSLSNVEAIKVSRKIYSIVRKLNPEKKLVRYTQLRWSNVFSENASDQLTVILRYIGITRTFDTVADVYQSQALDPHVNRYRFREEWWA